MRKVLSVSSLPLVGSTSQALALAIKKKNLFSSNMLGCIPIRNHDCAIDF